MTMAQHRAIFALSMQKVGTRDKIDHFNAIVGSKYVRWSATTNGEKHYLPSKKEASKYIGYLKQLD